MNGKHGDEEMVFCKPRHARAGMTPSRKLRLIILFLVLAVTVGCDQTSNHIARKKLSQRGSITLPGGVGELRLENNPGSFLGLGTAFSPSLRRAVFTVGVGAGLMILFAWLVGRARLKWLSFLGLALAMAGGTSNLVDRITQQGEVTDFIFIQVGPIHTGVFNVADILIMLGLAMVAVAIWKQQTLPKQQVGD
jgi:signal peptidase II